MSPFVDIAAQDKMVLDIRIFWAIAGPITLCVVFIWLLWTGRAQITKYFAQMKKSQ